jgi:hypothetical protein
MTKYLFHFRQKRYTIGRLSFNDIVSYRIPPMEFPDDETRAIWEADKAFFEREFFKWRNPLQVVRTDEGPMRVCEWRFSLKNWIISRANELMGTEAVDEAQQDVEPDIEIAAPQAQTRTAEQNKADQAQQEMAQAFEKRQKALAGLEDE